MTVQFARLLAALALMLALGFGLWAAPVALAQDDTATEVTEEGEGVIEEIDEEVDDAVDSAQTEAAQITEEDDDFDDWGLIGLLGLLGLGGLLRRPDRSVIVDRPETRTSPLDRT